jgi:hypothetical protein
MTMHLEGPWLTTTGKIRSRRRKYHSAEAARQDRELQAEWQQRQAEWNKLTPKFAGQRNHGKASHTLARTPISPQYPPGREPQMIPSRDTGGGSTARPADKVYTGTKIKGIGTLHKSNAVPIFSDDEAVEIAHMRR